MSDRIWTISNTISVSRVGLLIPFGYCLFTEFPGNRVWAVGLLLVAVASDFLDGYLARRLHQVSEWGKIVDPLADKIGVAGISLFLVLLKDVPAWFLFTLMVRDLLIVIGGVYIKRKKNIITQSNWPGKVTVNAIALYLLLSIVREPGLEGFRSVALWTSLVMMTGSLAFYARRLLIGRGVETKG